jgi:hypothetical protein
MLGFNIKIEDTTKNVAKAVDRASFRNVGHAAASVRKTAAASIEKSAGPSQPGRPPHTKKGRLKRAIRFHVDKQKQEAIVGPQASMVGEVGEALEFGKEFRGDQYEERPFMGPARDANTDRFGNSFKGSIGE